MIGHKPWPLNNNEMISHVKEAPVAEVVAEGGDLRSTACPCPSEKAGFISRWTYHWTAPLFRLAKRRLLCLDDLYRVPGWLESSKLTAGFEERWAKMQKEKRSWSWLLLTFQFWDLSTSGILTLLSDLLSWFCPALIKALLERLKSRESGTFEEPQLFVLYLLPLLFLFLTVSRAFLESFSGYLTSDVGYRTRAAIMGLMYKKSLRFSQASRQKYSTGSALNVLSVDSNKIYTFIFSSHQVWMIPCRLCVATFLCVYYLGVSALPGLFFICLVIPVLVFVAKLLKKYRTQLSRVSDLRMQVTQESLHGVKLLKYFAWEEIAALKINSLREEELKYLKKVNLVFGFALAINFWAPIFAATISIGTYAFVTGQLDAESVFAASIAFQGLITPLRSLPNLIGTMISAKTAIERISAFLGAPEIGDCIERGANKQIAVCIKDADMFWEAPPVDLKQKKGGKKKKKRRVNLEMPCDPDEMTVDRFKLRNINIEIPTGSLVAIMGPIGSGKTTLLEAVMGDLTIEKGTVSVAKGTIGYCEQHAWIRNASLRDNIVFGRPFDSFLYQKVIEECCLTSDVASLPFGDETIIGEKGATVSGGQKQRIGLARVMYAMPSIALLDDPFSAVDASVSRQLFYGIKDGLLKDKTRIIATHNRNILEEVDIIIVLDKGKVRVMASYDEIINSTDPKLHLIRQTFLRSPQYEDDDCESDNESAMSQLSDSISDSEAEKPVLILPKNQRKQKKPRKNDEKIAKKASSQSIQAYIRGCGGWRAMVLLLVLILMTEVSRVSKDLFMKSQMQSDVSSTTMSPLDFVLGFSALGVLQGLLCMAVNIISVICCNRASRLIHHLCIDRILAARMSIFDTTPIGRILNRFGSDLDTIDNNFPTKMTFLVTCLSIVLSAFLIVLWLAPRMAITFILPVIGAVYLQKQFGRVWRQLQQLNGQALGPIMSHFSETLAGLTTIRTLDGQRLFTRIFYTLLDEYSKTNYLGVSVRRWVGLRSEIVANLYVFFLMVLCVYLRIPYTTAGLLMVYMVNAADSIDWSMKTLAEVESCFISVERLYKYVMDLEIEQQQQQQVEKHHQESFKKNKLCSMGSKDGEGAEQEKDQKKWEEKTMTAVPIFSTEPWPSKGKVEFSKVTISYRPDLPPALSDIDLVINPGEKIAVVGRTGAGKSSIIACIFRFFQLTRGQILIDGVDISLVPLKKLRRSLAMVPQDPVLFAGSLRKNLDPELGRTDEEIWHSLECAFMKEAVQSHPDKLEAEAGEGGGNFSIGQRQLLCLARAILRHSCIVIMDEATSSIDRETDELIQQSLRTSFQHSTVITIAHRLETIMNYDRVIVMAEGRIIEAGQPRELALRHGSHFSHMVQTSGISIE